MAEDNKTVQQDTGRFKRNKEETTRNNRRRTRQLIGLALSVLIIVGTISIVQNGLRFLESALDNTLEKEEYQSRVEMMVWFNTLPFGAPEQADENFLRQIAIWGVYQQEKDSGTLARNSLGAALIPFLEVDLFASNLFGPNFQFHEHTPFSEPIQGMIYNVDDENKSYILPVTGLQPTYLPNVAAIKKESGGIKRVTVGYVNATKSYENLTPLTEEDYQNPDFYMDYVFQRDGSKYYLARLESSSMVPPAKITSSSSTPAMQDVIPTEEDDISSDAEKE